jgi:hypothetical protein
VAGPATPPNIQNIASTTGTVAFNCASATAGTVTLFQATGGSPITLTGNMTMTSSGCTQGQIVAVYVNSGTGPYMLSAPSGWDVIPAFQKTSTATTLTWVVGNDGNGHSEAGGLSANLTFQKGNGVGGLAGTNLSENADGSDTGSKAIGGAPPYKPTFNAGGTTTCDLSQSNVCEVDFGAGNTTLAFSNPHYGTPYYLLRSCQDAIGGRTYTFAGTMRNFAQPDPAAGTTNCTEQPFTFDGTNYQGGTASVPTSAWHGVSSPEGTAPTGVPGSDVLYADSTAHRWKMNNNNGGAAQVVAAGADINTSDQVTSVHLTSPLSVGQGGTGTTTPGLLQGINITISGSWPNQTINSTGGSASTPISGNDGTGWWAPFGLPALAGSNMYGALTTRFEQFTMPGGTWTFNRISISIGLAPGVTGIVALYDKTCTTKLATFGPATVTSGINILTSASPITLTVGSAADSGTYWLGYSNDTNFQINESSGGAYGLLAEPSHPRYAVGSNNATGSTGTLAMPSSCGTLTAIATTSGLPAPFILLP